MDQLTVLMLRTKYELPASIWLEYTDDPTINDFHDFKRLYKSFMLEYKDLNDDEKIELSDILEMLNTTKRRFYMYFNI